MTWLKHALDINQDGGAAQAYFMKKGRWSSSYSETTGYIIPTFYDYTKLRLNQKYIEAAKRMAYWECDVKLSNGSVRAGTMDDNKEDPKPTIFKTGQVFFGWAMASGGSGSLSQDPILNFSS